MAEENGVLNSMHFVAVVTGILSIIHYFGNEITEAINNVAQNETLKRSFTGGKFHSKISQELHPSPLASGHPAIMGSLELADHVEQIVYSFFPPLPGEMPEILVFIIGASLVSELSSV